MKTKSWNRRTTWALALAFTLGVASVRAQDTNEQAETAASGATTSANAAPAGEAATPAAASATKSGRAAEVIPLIVMDDLPLTDAIRNLARQAGINYLIDPKVAYGAPGPDGKVVPMPTVSIRWENVTAQQALEALLNNYDLQLVQDPKTGIGRITVKDPSAPEPLVTQIIQLKYASPTNVALAIQGVLMDRRSKVIPDVRTRQLIVAATEQEHRAIEDIVARLDAQSKQVLIEGRLLEVSVSPKSIKGIDWSGTLGGQRVVFGNGTTIARSTTTIPGQTTTTTLPGGRTITSQSRYSEQTEMQTVFDPLAGGGLSLNTFRGLTPNIGFLSADGVSAVLSFLNSHAESRVLSAPRTVTLDNEPTFIEVGQMYPIVNVTPGTVQTAGGSQVTYSNLTLRLEVTPSISANNVVNLKVRPSILRLGPRYTTKVGGVENEVDSFFKREMETRVLIPSGHTLVLGGLLQDQISSGSTKVPVLGDLPLLGAAFRSRSKDRDKMNLLIFITPTIVEDKDYQETPTDFLSTRPPAGEALEDDWSAWDSGEPLRWSKRPERSGGRVTP
ncbi:MAG: hypothetical protein N2438_08165 [Limisphaera sp.]|nr:hypothetical protein [Limisphaera sp.]